jgi:uncharacterized protein YndB with AHSA1/START domain
MDAKRESESAKNRTKVQRKSDREIVVTRTFNAPARIVFEAWTKPELFKQWWAPKSMGMTLVSCQMDVRVGGRYRLNFGDGMDFFGKYLEVTPPSRLVWTNDESGETGPVTTLTLEEKGGKTLLVLHEVYPSKEALDTAGGAAEALGEQFDQLDELLAGQPMTVLKRFQCSVDIAAPAFKVYQVLIEPDSYKQWTSAFGEGLYFEGSWQKGERIRFLTPDGHGVTSEIAENRPGEFLSVRHLGYINDDGVEDTTSEVIRAWAPAYENYTFATTPQGTKLTVDQDITDDFESMPEAWPKALAILKALSEARLNDA